MCGEPGRSELEVKRRQDKREVFEMKENETPNTISLSSDSTFCSPRTVQTYWLGGCKCVGSSVRALSTRSSASNGGTGQR